LKLTDKVVAITGGSKGFGRALAEAFIKEGARVTICALHKDELEKTGKEIGALAVVADVRSEEDMQRFADETIKKYGALDIWVNNAGIWLPHAVAEDFDMDQVREMFDINVIGLMNGSRVALRRMKKQKSGIIINVLSQAALGNRAGLSTYAASKWAANGFTKTIREEAQNSGISVFGVYPGGMKTEIFHLGPPVNFNDFMDTQYVAEKIISNLKLKNPEEELSIKRPNA